MYVECRCGAVGLKMGTPLHTPSSGPLNYAILKPPRDSEYHADTIQEYEVADDRLKASLPPVIQAAFSILPHLLATQIMTQHTLLAQYYTLLHGFCDEENFPNPPPPAGQLIQTWDQDFRPAQKEIETGLHCVSSGKTVRMSMRIEEKPHGSVTGLNIRNGISAQTNRRPSQQTIDDKSHGSVTGLNIRNGVQQRLPSNQQPNALKPPPSPAISATSDPPSPDYRQDRPRISSAPSQTLLGLATPNYNSSIVTSPSPGDPAMHAPAGPRGDYFGRDRLPSGSSMASIAAGKKKPPPPKRMPSTQGFFVTALYDFAGEGYGDLSFREGDRIKVVRKTQSTDDWWEGELKGVQGSFPANYCQAI